MDENQQEEGISFVEICRILIRKFYILLIAFVVAATLGSAIGYFQNRNIKYYGDKMEFKITLQPYTYSYSKTQLATITNNLTSDVFFRDYVVPNIEGAPTTNTTYPHYDEEKLRSFIKSIKSCVTYSYNEDYSNAIYAKVQVLNNESFAQVLLEKVEEGIVTYVQERNNIIVPTDSNEYTVRCQYVSMASAHLLNPGQTKSTMVKYGVISAFAALILAAVTIIVIDNSNAKIRNFENFAIKNDVAVLGVIPKENEDFKNTDK